jgi:hypothetical protein
MNGYHNSPLHVPACLKETNPEVLGCFVTDSPLRKIRMADINVRQCERQRQIVIRGTPWVTRLILVEWKKVRASGQHRLHGVGVCRRWC